MNYKLEIAGMTCGACSKSITLKLQKHELVSEVNINDQTGSGKITVTGSGKEVLDSVKNTIESLGFKLTKISRLD